MGAAGTTSITIPKGLKLDVDTRRVRSLHSVGEVVRLYEELERALAQMDDGALAYVATASRGGERALAICARRVARMRAFERGPLLPPLHHLAQRTPSQIWETVRVSRPRRRQRLVWEAIAFALGFGVSILLIAGGA